jgi:hypothetical protein
MRRRRRTNAHFNHAAATHGQEGLEVRIKTTTVGLFVAHKAAATVVEQFGREIMPLRTEIATKNKTRNDKSDGPSR